MVRTVSFFFLIWLSLFLSIILFIPFPVFFLGNMKKAKRKYIWFCAHNWSRFALFLSGSELIVDGTENIPNEPHFVILSNHQGFMDIPILLAVFPYPVSFVAKKELLGIPLINLWLLSLECLTIDRAKPIKAQNKISKRLKQENKNPLVIFPEGTRSRSEAEGSRKKGGINLVQKSGIPVLYVRISGSYKIYEERGRIQPSQVKVKITENYEKLGK